MGPAHALSNRLVEQLSEYLDQNLLQPCAVLAVEQSNVLHVGVGNVVLDTRILADRAH